MLRICEGSKYPEQTEFIVSQYRRENGIENTGTNSGDTIVALDEDTPVGFISHRSGRIGTLYVRDDAPADTGDRLLRAAMAVCMNRGISSLSIHSLDPCGRTENICRNAGFTEDGMCTCSQREGMVCLRLRF